MAIGPVLPLSLLVGLFHTALYVFARDSAGGRLPLVYAAASLGAWAGDALAGRVGLDLASLGDYRLLGASIGAWCGIGLVAVVAILGPEPRLPGPRRGR